MSIFDRSCYSNYFDLPDEESLLNPLINILPQHREDSEMVEFVKLGAEHFSPEFGVMALLNKNIYPFQMSMLRAILRHKFPMILMTRGGSKTFSLALSSLYISIFFPGTRIILISGTFRQSKLIFKEIIRIYQESPLLRSLAENRPVIANDNCNFMVNGSSIIALPLGAGDKIRGERGHVVFVDEFDSISKEVFDVVIRGFGAVQSDPWMKTMDHLRRLRRVKSSASKVRDDASSMMHMIDAAGAGNKIVVSGTAGHNTGPFCKLHSQYMKIIGHKMEGNLKQYAELLGSDEGFDESVSVDYRQYCVVRYTYLQLPPSMMDVQMISNARATMSKMYFSMEYLCEFADDSLGFFKHRDVKAATQPPGGWSTISKGQPGKKYVLSIDPARTIDRFAVAIVELGQPNRVIYAWSSQGKKYSESMDHVRKLLKRFDVAGISLDATGGTGVAIKDLFGDPAWLDEGQRPIVPFDAKPEETPANALKILYPFVFNPVWIEEANMLLQKSIEDKTIQFPVETFAESVSDGSEFVERDEATDEINQMKRELISIEISYTTSGTKKFNLKPPSANAEPEETVLHKDRYSALLLANYLACKLGKIEGFDKDAAARAGYQDPATIGGWAAEFAK